MSFVPRNALILSALSLITCCFFGLGYTSIIPSTTSPAPSISTSSHALSTAGIVVSTSSPFSNLDDASVLMPRAREVTRTLAPLKFALSKTTVFVSSVISLFAPPITPARATAFFSSAITSIPLFKVWSISSSDLKLSFSLASLTMICEPSRHL